ncbi:MAG: UDP-N-acetylglucosamine 2-epimerase, partial [Ignavibacteria bacterium]|nr:UDP-N-acetylglucosamine 2-epimerase [Ignavibacteria bacterium]
GFPAEQVIKTGSPMFEVLHFYKDKIAASDVVARLNLTKEKYFVVSSHREENVDSEPRLRKIADIIYKVCEKYNYPIIFSTHPRTRKQLENFKIELHPLVHTLKPLGFFDYIQLQKESYCVISDSGTITEEASILNFPAINLRDVHERPEGMEEGVAIMTGLNPIRVLESIPITVNVERGESRSIQLVSDYYAPSVSDKVLKIILSYTDFVRRRVWKEYE